MDLLQIPNIAEVVTFSEVCVVKIDKFSNYIFFNKIKRKLI